MLITVLLAGGLLLGLVLLAAGIVLLIKVKNKIAGALVTAFGVVFTILPIVVFLALTVTTSLQGGM